MNQHQRPNTFRTTLQAKIEAELLATKYRGYASQGMLVLAVTLSTYVPSDRFAASAAMSYFWNEHFIRRIRRVLPFKLQNKLDHDYVVEKSPDGYWHYHGFLVVPMEAAHRIWHDGALDQRLKRDLDALHTAGEYRPFQLNKYLIEPVREDSNEEAWAGYITKTSGYVSSASGAPL
jgi:hypothetical protein